jgi:hypothetical protein
MALSSSWKLPPHQYDKPEHCVSVTPDRRAFLVISSSSRMEYLPLTPHVQLDVRAFLD